MDARHVEIHIEVDRTMTIQRAHDIVKAVGQTTEELEHIIQAFVHTDPVPV
jgi:divalent metal cation (Fe/Co/Zn/Cd) transporter